MKKILITAFEPFGEDIINPTQKILEALPDVVSAGVSTDAAAGSSMSTVCVGSAAGQDRSVQIIKLLLPVSFDSAPKMALEAIEKLHPHAVISLGLAPGRSAVTPERVAINCMDARIADNDGSSPCDLPVAEGGPAAYFSTLPIKRITEAIAAEGIPSAVSNSAGTYVCNALMYSVLHYVSDGHRGSLSSTASDGKMLCGFIHVPYTIEMGKTPALSLEDEIRAVRTAISVCLDRDNS